MSMIVRAVHQSSSKLGDTPLARLDLFESLPSRRFGCRASTTNSTAKSRSTSLYNARSSSRGGCRALQLYSALHLYSSTALYTLHPLHPPSGDGWPPTSALALLVKMAAVAIAATKVQAYSAQAPVVFRLLSHFAHARAARPASLREGMSLPRFDPAAKSCSLEPRPTLPPRPQLLSTPENWCLICCLPADAAGEPGDPLYFMAPSKWGWLTRQRSILWTTHRMPRMPEGEGGEARGRLSCSRVISLWGVEGPDGPVTFVFRARGGRRIRGRIESALPCSTADRQARRQHPQGGSI